MRILNLIQCTNLGGMERASFELMCALKAEDHHVEYISLAPLGALESELRENQINVSSVKYGARSSWSVLWDIRRKIRIARPDALIMTGHNLLANLALIGLQPKSRILSIHFHHQGVMATWKWQLVYALAFTSFQHITFPSDFVRKEAEKIAPWIKKKSRTVRNPLKPLMPLPNKTQARITLGLNKKSTVIGNAGWLIPRKRFDVFLNVAAEFVKHHDDAVFLVAGDGELMDELRALSRKLGIEGNVKWLGWQKSMDRFYASLDAVLFTSDWDAMGMTAIEAMAHGVPVVASVKNGGLVEVMDSSSGWFHDDHDIKALASSLNEAVGGEGKKKAEAARARVLELADTNKLKYEFETMLGKVR